MTRHRFKTTYLHIGLEKTGTTSVQAFLDTNRARLAERGVFFPRSLGAQNQKALAAYALEDASKDAATKVRGAPEEIAGFREGLEQRFAEEAATRTESTLLISSEDLSRLFRPDEIDRALSFLSPYSDAIRVIVFLRRQDLLAASRYYSLVLGGRRKAAVFPSGKEVIPPYYNYHKTLSGWISKVGAANILPCHFPENPGAAKFSSVTRFCEILNLNPTEFTPVQDRNISLDAVNQIIIQKFNSTTRTLQDKARLEELTTALSAYRSAEYRYVSSARQARDFYARLEPGNQALFADLGLPADYFSDDFSMYPGKNMRSAYLDAAVKRLLNIHMGLT
jgi:hypothetical protein